MDDTFTICLLYLLAYRLDREFEEEEEFENEEEFEDEEEFEEEELPDEIVIPANVGGLSYTKQEVLSLMNAIENVLPIGSEQWNEVLATHCSQYPGRKAKSIQRKFRNLQGKSISSDDPGCPEEVKMARRIKSKIAEKRNQARKRESEEVAKRYKREIEHPDCPEAERLAKETFLLIEEKKRRLALKHNDVDNGDATDGSIERE